MVSQSRFANDGVGDHEVVLRHAILEGVPEPVDHSHLASWTDDELTEAWQQLGVYEGDDTYIVVAREAVAREREFRRVMPHVPRPSCG